MSSITFAVFPSRFEFFISDGEDGCLACAGVVGWGDAESGVKVHGVAMVEEAAAGPFGIIEGEGVLGWMASSLRVVRRADDVGVLPEADKFFEVLGHELGAVIGDDALACFGMGFAGLLDNDLGVGFADLRADAQERMGREAPSRTEQR